MRLQAYRCECGHCTQGAESNPHYYRDMERRRHERNAAIDPSLTLEEFAGQWWDEQPASMTEPVRRLQWDYLDAVSELEQTTAKGNHD